MCIRDSSSTNIQASVEGIITNSSGDLTGDLVFHTNAGDSLTEKVRITSAGKVGIGSDAPTLGLDINKGANSGVFLGNTTHGYKIRANVTSSHDYGLLIEDEDGVDLYRVVSSTGSSNANTHTWWTDGDERLCIESDGKIDLKVAGYEADIYSTGSGDRWPLRLFNSDTTSGNMTGIYFGPCNNVAGAYISGKAEADFTSTANRDAGLEFGTRLNGNWKIPMEISAVGYVTKPLQPYFHVQASPSVTNTPHNNGVKSFGTINVNNGSHYDNSTGVFTCPVAGFYFFSAGIWSSNSDNSAGATLLILLRRDSSGNNPVQFASHNHRTYQNSLTISAGYYCASGDQIYLDYNGSVQGSTPRNYFSGCLLG